MSRFVGLLIIMLLAIATIILGVGYIIDQAAEYKRAEQTRMPEILAQQGQNMLNSAHATNMLLAGAFPYVLLIIAFLFGVICLLALFSLVYLSLAAILRIKTEQPQIAGYLPPPNYYYQIPEISDSQVIRGEARMYKRYR